jgi:hypothetical protein
VNNIQQDTAPTRKKKHVQQLPKEWVTEECLFVNEVKKSEHAKKQRFIIIAKERCKTRFDLRKPEQLVGFL